MMSKPIRANSGSYSARANVLVISGVNISKPFIAEDLAGPEKDYQVLLDAIQPDVIDISNIQAITNPLIVLARPLHSLTWAVAFAALQRAAQYRVIVATGEDVGLRMAFLLRLFKLGTPLIITCHNISSRRPGFFLRYLNVGKAVHTFQCLSKAQENMLAGYPGIRTDNIRLIYWHVDHHFFAPMPDVPIKDQICSAGMASRDYATLVTAAADLDIDVKIAAYSPWFHQKLNIVAKKVSPHVEVRSYQNYQALRHLYAESRFVVVPLLDVPYSAGYTVILEAMAMGKAVIVSRIKQRDDFVLDGWNGLYVEPGNVTELREKICFLLKRPDEAFRLGMNARKTVEERFTLHHYLERMEEDIDYAMRCERQKQIE